MDPQNPQQPPSQAAPAILPKKVLIVEDDFFIRDLYQIEAQKFGYLVSYAADGEEALNKIKTEHPDIILLDLMLPKIDGIEVLKTLKSDPTLSKIPVIIATNVEDPEKEKEALSLGALDYMLKVRFTPDKIIENLKKYLTPT